jgi:hypothetical protein
MRNEDFVKLQSNVHVRGGEVSPKCGGGYIIHRNAERRGNSQSNNSSYSTLFVMSMQVQVHTYTEMYFLHTPYTANTEKARLSGTVYTSMKKSCPCRKNSFLSLLRYTFDLQRCHRMPCRIGPLPGKFYQVRAYLESGQ